MMQHDKPRIGYILKRFPRFSETFILNELLQLERQDVRVDVLSLRQPPEEDRHEFLSLLRAPVIYLPDRSALGAWNMIEGMAEESRKDIDIKAMFQGESLPFRDLFPGKRAAEISLLCLQATTVAMLATARGIQHLHAHFASNATTVALLASRLSGIPFSFTAHARDIYHTYIDSETDDDLRRRKIAEAQFVVTVSDYNRRHLSQIAGRPADARIRRLYNGIDLTRFRPDPNSCEPDLFVAVGRLIEKKGFPYLVEACRVLRSRGRRFRCLIIGEGPEREALTRHIQQARLSQQVTLAGAQPQEQLIQTMRRAAAVVLPCVVSASGDRDGLPTVLLEAMAMGIPAISTDVAGIPEIIDHDQTGFLVPPENPPALADAMQRILLSPELRIHLGREGRLKAERDFDLRTNVGVLATYFARSAAGQRFDGEDIRDVRRIRAGSQSHSRIRQRTRLPSMSKICSTPLPNWRMR